MDGLDSHDDVPNANMPDAASERSVNESSVFRYLTRRRVGRVRLTRTRSGRRVHNQKELINPDEAVACGAAVQAEHHRVKRHLNSVNKPSVACLPPC